VPPLEQLGHRHVGAAVLAAVDLAQHARQKLFRFALGVRRRGHLADATRDRVTRRRHNHLIRDTRGARPLSNVASHERAGYGALTNIDKWPLSTLSTGLWKSRYWF